MRSFLSRFTLPSVAALALAGLVAGCSGSTSSSLPATSGGGAAAKAAPQMMSNVHQMTPQQIANFNTMLQNALKKQPRGQSSSTGIPGAFGLSTFPTGNPNPLGGIQGNITAYSTAQFTLPTSNAQPNSDLYLALISPGGNTVGSGCFIPYYVYQNDQGAVNNLVGWIDECARPVRGVFGTLNTAFYVSGTTPPLFTAQVTSDNSGANWAFAAFCYGCTPAQFVTQDTDSTGNGNPILPGNGFAGWIESPLAGGPCKPLPTPSGGLQINAVQYAPPGSATFTPATAANTIFDPPNTNIQTCFKNDGSGIGAQYFINALGQPFFTSSGAQFVVTSQP
ncbi:MAG: hypothetical protein JO033_12530 [Acidobacteriaceae bacterium]|nr:hypothetical protein [Acidobacteriaceae bacterium]